MTPWPCPQCGWDKTFGWCGKCKLFHSQKEMKLLWIVQGEEPPKSNAGYYLSPVDFPLYGEVVREFINGECQYKILTEEEECQIALSKKDLSSL